MYHSPCLPLTMESKMESKIENKQYYIVHPFYNKIAYNGIDICDFILSHNSILMVSDILYKDHYLFPIYTDILHGGMKTLGTQKSIILKGFVKDDLVYGGMKTLGTQKSIILKGFVKDDLVYGGMKTLGTQKSIILKGFVKDDLVYILKMINYTLNTELKALHNDLGKFSNNVIDSKVLTNHSSHYIIEQTDYDIEAPLYVAEINDDGYVLFNGKYLLTVNNDLKIVNVISYFNFVCSLIGNDKCTYKKYYY